MEEWHRVGRPKALGSRKQGVIQNWNNFYGKDNWRVGWVFNGSILGINRALAVYEQAYVEYFNQHPEELRWIAENYEDVYDNHPSNVQSGLNYNIQEFGGNHFQDIAIRRVMARNGLQFTGTGLLEIRMSEPGKKWSPGEIPFNLPELIQKPEVEGWWKPGSLESWYQSARHLETTRKDIRLDHDLYFVTSNKGKVESARRSLGTEFSIDQLVLDIAEEQETIEEIASHKAQVAYAVICRPVICDDSGFVIPSLQGYPSVKVGRELSRIGIQGFMGLAGEQPLDAHFAMAVTYFDEATSKPQVFVSKTEGRLIGEMRGDINKPFVKSPLAGCFIVNGQTKTIAEMTEEEYKAHATTNRWGALLEFLKQHRRASK